MRLWWSGVQKLAAHVTWRIALPHVEQRAARRPYLDVFQTAAPFVRQSRKWQHITHALNTSFKPASRPNIVANTCRWSRCQTAGELCVCGSLLCAPQTIAYLFRYKWAVTESGCVCAAFVCDANDSINQSKRRMQFTWERANERTCVSKRAQAPTHIQIAQWGGNCAVRYCWIRMSEWMRSSKYYDLKSYAFMHSTECR